MGTWSLADGKGFCLWRERACESRYRHFGKNGKSRDLGLVDNDLSLEGKDVFGYKVFGPWTDDLCGRFRNENVRSLIGIGVNKVRTFLAQRVAEGGIGFVTGIHPSAQISRGVRIGKGTVVMAGVVINADSEIGDHVIVNTGARIDHDCQIGNGVHIAPGVVLCGTVKIGAGTMIGAGSVILPNLTIGENCVVGAGSTVSRPLVDGEKVVGMRARPLQEMARLFPRAGKESR